MQQPDVDIPPLAPLDESPRVVDDRVAAARNVADVFGTQWSATSDEAPLPFVKPSFSVKEMFLGVTAVAVYLGLLRSLGPNAVVALQLVYALCCWRWKRSERSAFQHLAFDLTGGMVLPMSVLFLIQRGLLDVPMVVVVAHIILLCMFLIAIWICFGAFLGPRSFAFISGALITGGVITGMAGILAAFFAVLLALIALTFSGDWLGIYILMLLAVPLVAGVIYAIHGFETFALAGDTATTQIARASGIVAVLITLVLLLAKHGELSRWWSGILIDTAPWYQL